MRFSFESTVIVTMDNTKGSNISSHVSTDFNISVSPNLNKRAYIGPDELPTQEGSKVLTTVLVQGLIGNIHHSHQNGYRDSAQHLRDIIEQLEQGFIAVGYISKSEFKM